MDYYRALHSSVILSWTCMDCTVMMNEPCVGEDFGFSDSFFNEDGAYTNIDQEDANMKTQRLTTSMVIR